MRKFLFSLVSLSFFAVFYLVVFSSNVEAGLSCPPNQSIAPTPVTCGVVCPASPVAICPALNASDTCNCPGASADCFGTDGDDIICGSDTGEEIFAGEGDDIVCAGDGDDILHGGWGCDDLQGEGDADDGGIGDDLRGGHCADSLIGDTDDDADDCRGGWGADDIDECAGINKPGKTCDHKKDRGCDSSFCQGS